VRPLAQHSRRCPRHRLGERLRVPGGRAGAEDEIACGGGEGADVVEGRAAHVAADGDGDLHRGVERYRDLVERERAVDHAALVECRDRGRYLREPQELLSGARDRDPCVLLEHMVRRRLEHAVCGRGLEDCEHVGVLYGLEATRARREARLLHAGHAGAKDLEHDRRAALDVGREEGLGHRDARALYPRVELEVCEGLAGRRHAPTIDHPRGFFVRFRVGRLRRRQRQKP